jgi:hypothetical protein
VAGFLGDRSRQGKERCTISSASAVLPLSISERTMKLQPPPLGVMPTMPRLFEVSTTPATRRLRRRTPCGAAAATPAR